MTANCQLHLDFIVYITLAASGQNTRRTSQFCAMAGTTSELEKEKNQFKLSIYNGGASSASDDEHRIFRWWAELIQKWALFWNLDNQEAKIKELPCICKLRLLLFIAKVFHTRRNVEAV
jgi:hypothetical protein